MTLLRKDVMNSPGKDIIELELKDEKKFRESFFSQSTPILPGELFLAPNIEIVTRLPGKPLFPEFTDMEEEIEPESLPFDVALLHGDNVRFFNPAPPSPPSATHQVDVKPEPTNKDQSDLVDSPHEDDIVASPETAAGDVIPTSPVTQEDDIQPEPSNKEQFDEVDTSANDKIVVPPDTLITRKEVSDEVDTSAKDKIVVQPDT